MKRALLSGSATAALFGILTPLQALAQSSSAGSLNVSYVQDLADTLIGLINFALLPALIAVAFIVFLYGVFRYFILGAANEEDRKIGRTYVLYGIFGFFIIFSVWGLVYVVADFFNVGVGANTLPPPTL